MGMLGVDENTLAAMPGLENAVHALTIECLTAPYDRTFVDCVRRVPVRTFREGLPEYFRCVTLRNPDLATECLRHYGPGQVCYAEFRMRRQASAGEAVGSAL